MLRRKAAETGQRGKSLQMRFDFDVPGGRSDLACAVGTEVLRHADAAGIGPCLESLRNIEVPSFVFTSNDSHAYIPFTNSVSRSKGNPLILVAEWRWKSAAGFMI